MRIVITTRVLPFHSIGGMQVITWDLAKEFAKKGHHVSCITTAIHDKPEQFNQDGVDVVALVGTMPGKHSHKWWQLSKQFVEKTYLNDCDVLLSVSASAFGVLSLKPKMKNTVFVFQGHGTSLSEMASKLRLHTFKSLLSMVKNIKWLAIDLFKYPAFDGIIAAGDRVYRDLNNPFYRFFLSNKPVVSIPNGIDTDLFHPSVSRRETIRSKFKIKQDDYLILIASRLHKQKGIYQAVTAFSRYHDQDDQARLLILGDGPEKKDIAILVAKLNISDVVDMPGSVPIDQLPEYLNSSDVYLFTTLHEEGLPLLPLESLASGIPVVTSDHLLEITSCGDSVLPVNPRNIDSIVNGINQSKKIVSNAESFLPAKYRLDECSRMYLNYFKSLQLEKSNHTNNV